MSVPWRYNRCIWLFLFLLLQLFQNTTSLRSPLHLIKDYFKPFLQHYSVISKFWFWINWTSPWLNIVFLMEPRLHGYTLRWISAACIPDCPEWLLAQKTIFLLVHLPRFLPQKIKPFKIVRLGEMQVSPRHGGEIDLENKLGPSTEKHCKVQTEPVGVHKWPCTFIEASEHWKEG